MRNAFTLAFDLANRDRERALKKTIQFEEDVKVANTQRVQILQEAKKSNEKWESLLQEFNAAKVRVDVVLNTLERVKNDIEQMTHEGAALYTNSAVKHDEHFDKMGAALYDTYKADEAAFDDSDVE
eukprot:gb/GEZN01021567.1/.p1 GENE.gb/GEZN01021567.1/~~gb/GEZN01021567.1/.p1  ORF type:complete len:126 (+),score=20.79 gb/GEZN01021567.1/:263-640(+)